MTFRSILDERLYRNSSATDLRLTFDRARREERRQRQRANTAPAGCSAKP